MNFSSGNARHLPRWRRLVAPVLLGALRLAVATVLAAGPVQLLLESGRFASELVQSPASRYGLAATLAIGALLYTWRRTLLIGLPLLLLGLGAYEWFWRQTGFSDRLLWWGTAALIALAVTEVLLARTQRRLYGEPVIRVSARGPSGP